MESPDQRSAQSAGNTEDTLRARPDEPAYIYGSIQPHGLLFVLQYPDLTVLQVSENTKDCLGIEAKEFLGTPFSDWLPAAQAALLQKYLASAGPATLIPLPIDLKARGKTMVSFSCLAHLYPNRCVIELEDLSSSNASQLLQPSVSTSKHLHLAFDKIHRCTTLGEALALTTQELRRITGYDRIMIYKFDQDWSGEIVAEDRKKDLEPHLGLHYPATDVPEQIRELYKRNPIRLIPDVNHQPSKIIPELDPHTNKPVNLSDSILRGVSPVHLEYLRKLNVQAALIISLIVHDELWGLIICHHNVAKSIAQDVRGACALFGQTLALQILAYETQEHNRLIRLAQPIFTTLVDEARRVPNNLSKALHTHNRELMELFNCSGMVLHLPDNVMRWGHVPSATDLTNIVEYLSAEGEHLQTIDNLPARLEAYGSLSPAGLLALAVGIKHTQWLIFFRPEYRQSLSWANNPNTNTGPSKVTSKKVTSRSPFVIWTEQTEGKSKSWTKTDRDIATWLRALLIDLERAEHEKSVLLQEAWEQQRREISASLAHDLKAPLEGSLRVVNLMAQRVSSKVDKDELELLHSLSSSLSGLLERVKGLVHSYRSMDGDLAIVCEPVDVKRVMHSTIYLLQGLANNKNITIEVTMPEHFTAFVDESCLKRIFENIIHNAIKYSPSNSSIKITGKTSENKAIISITDKGSGIAPEILSNVFLRKGEKGEPTSRGLAVASGLGLFIARKLIELNNGTIQCDSTSNQGTTFSITLPLAETLQSHY